MAKRNVTIRLDESVIHQAKMIAAKRGTSVSGLVARELEDLAPMTPATSSRGAEPKRS